MKQYGNTENVRDGYPLAAWIWGHRLRAGQHWMEYLLEFLNVLAGFEYHLGQGISSELDDGRSQQLEYLRYGRLGLRRFVFYDEHEKTPHAFDTFAIAKLREQLKSATWLASAPQDDPFVLAKKLLRSFSAVEEQRSWYAKTLLPAHHSMLLWEALRKGATKKDTNIDPATASIADLDKDIAYDARNFFARGGELYYLMLSAGTLGNSDLTQRIESRLSQFLNERNVNLGDLARLIDEAWNDIRQDGTQDGTGRLGWILDPTCAFYRVVAEDVSCFLEADIDPLESLELLSHLICFHLVLYIYHRAHPASTESRHEGDCATDCRPTLLLDIQSGWEHNAIRNASAATFRDQEAYIKQKARGYVDSQLRQWAETCPTGSDIWSEVEGTAREHFAIKTLHGKTRNQYAELTDKLQLQLSRNEITMQQAIQEYGELLFDILYNDFSKNFKTIHSKLAKAIGFVAPQRGPNPRYVMGDALLKAITLAIIKPGEQLTFHAFVEKLYTRYGLVVGIQEATTSGLLERHRINSEYYQRNAAAFLEKLQHAGLAVEYSDATAMVYGYRDIQRP